MLSPEAIISWLLSKVKGMRRSRLKTLAALVSAATRRIGVGVLALGRAMPSAVGAKHRIKRVWRFLRNPMVETQAVLAALAASALPRRGPLVVLVDWTDLPPWRTLFVALARDGRSLPFFSKTIELDGGSMLEAEEEGRLRAAGSLFACVETPSRKLGSFLEGGRAGRRASPLLFS